MRILSISAVLASGLASIASAVVATVSAAQSTAIATECPNVQHTAAMPSATRIGSLIASYAHAISCAKAGLNAFCDPSHAAAPQVRRDQIIGHTMEMTTSWTTIESTSTTTTTVYLGSSSRTTTTADSIFTPKLFALETQPTSSPVSDPTSGISVVNTTVVKTITLHSSTVSASTTAKPNHASPASETCINNTSIDTQIYINISTISVPGFTYAPPSTSTSTSATFFPFFTASTITADATSAVTSSVTSKLTTSTTSKAASTDDTRGFTGAITSTLGSASSMKITLKGYPVPVGLVAALAACFAVALLL